MQVSSDLLFQQYKKKHFGPAEPKLHETGAIHVWKRQIVKTIKVDDQAGSVANRKKEQAKLMSKFKMMKRK